MARVPAIAMNRPLVERSIGRWLELVLSLYIHIVASACVGLLPIIYIHIVASACVGLLPIIYSHCLLNALHGPTGLISSGKTTRLFLRKGSGLCNVRQKQKQQQHGIHVCVAGRIGSNLYVLLYYQRRRARMRRVGL